MLFWIVAGLLLALSVVFVAGALRIRSDDARPDVAVYRDQLKELDRDRARGTLSSEEAEAARAEVARRLLAADQQTARISHGSGNKYIGLALIAVPVIGISLWTYLALGAPGYPDLPLQGRIAQIEANRADRPDQATAEAAVPDMIDDSRDDIIEMSAKLKEVLLERPDDLQGWQLAVQTQSGLNDMESAWRSQNRVLAIMGDEARGADFALLAELMILAADGYVSPQAETALAEAVRRDPRNGTARYYAGAMYAQGGRPDRAFTIWRSLIADSTPDAPWLAPIYAQIERVSVLAGDPTPIDELPQPLGPSSDDIAASQDLTPEQRVEMIGNMVQGLSERLATEGGSAADWARLITSYGVLGRTDDAFAIYEEAKTVFASDPDALDTLARAADRAGVNP
ncbi:cytochrome c-type biogenesis protein CcmH [Jannaschia faecimaris]|uniref:Cytochrome c-type biogenesis protein CcmH n=1 Tax=Jannaschia faecimaris TaxID=1244108 RepID=A0A1H3SQ74_9RHOB|nr:c-type cytochrome biogenesis protein CcmI [Jannaschia faecimaris]SDZ39870.1 cytochrome c-type biogenesis protein CcmH [Jannaschia faecimaris]